MANREKVTVTPDQETLLAKGEIMFETGVGGNCEYRFDRRTEDDPPHRFFGNINPDAFGENKPNRIDRAVYYLSNGQRVVTEAPRLVSTGGSEMYFFTFSVEQDRYKKWAGNIEKVVIIDGSKLAQE